MSKIHFRQIRMDVRSNTYTKLPKVTTKSSSAQAGSTKTKNTIQHCRLEFGIQITLNAPDRLKI